MENDTDYKTEKIDNIDNVEKKKSGKFMKILSLVLFLLLAGSAAWIYHITNDTDVAKSGLKNANSKISDMQGELSNLKIELDTTARNLKQERTANEGLKKENDSLRSIFPIFIRKIEVANADGSGHSISGYGKDIVASTSMYLMPRITYYAFKPGENIEIFVRLYGADGKCVTGNSSPEGYSYSYKINPILPGENTLALSGWGGADKGHFSPGTYRYEVWYDDMCLKSVTFKLK